MADSGTAYRRLAALLGAHFCADLFSGILAGFLPAVLVYFDMDLKYGAILLTCLGIGSNFLQVPAAKVAARRSDPAALIAGLVLCAAFTVLVLLPRTTPFGGLCLVMFCVGFGIALVHPQGLRGVQTLDSLPPRVSTPIFMIGGFLGYAVSPMIGGALVQFFGIRGILWILPLPAAVIAAILLTRVRLAVELPGKAAAPAASAAEAESRWGFGRLWIMALFLNTGTLTVSSLLPTMLHERGFSLGFGGFSAMLFGLGSASGSLLVGYAAKRFRPERLIVAGLCAGIPLCGLYLVLSQCRMAAVLLFFAGLCVAAGFPQMVALIRTVKSRFSLSTRTGLLVGWTWGGAGLIFLGMGWLASRYGVLTAVVAGVISYAVTLTIAVLPMPGRAGR